MIAVGRAMRKHKSVKKLSARRRGSFDIKKGSILTCSECGRMFEDHGSAGSGFEVLSCLFSPDTLCSYRKTKDFAIMDRCFKCPHYERFTHKMDEEDERVMDEIDRERAELDACR